MEADGAMMTRAALQAIRVTGRWHLMRPIPQAVRSTVINAALLSRLLKPRLLIADDSASLVDASLRAAILETLCNLQRDQGVSNTHIPHDLTAAYHIAKSIIVLYRDAVERQAVLMWSSGSHGVQIPCIWSSWFLGPISTGAGGYNRSWRRKPAAIRVAASSARAVR
jgi:hypothetical protein